MPTSWNLADVFEAIAAAVPDWPCQMQGERVISWGAFDRRANALAADLLAAGLTHQSKVAAYLQNGPEYLEVYLGAFKGGFAPVNTNFRYGPEEIAYLWANADAEAVVFHAQYAPLVDQVRGSLPLVRRWYVVSDATGDGAGLDWALPYESIVAEGADRTEGPWGRSGDDVLLLYTGGTTGMPKGVMWRQDDLFNVLGAGGNPLLGQAPLTSVAEAGSRLDPAAPGPVLLAACPLMHGTGQFTSFIVMLVGGSVVSLPSGPFDPGVLWQTVQRNGVNALVIVGDAFARPMLAELEARPGEHDTSTVRLITSSGVMWSQETKAGLLRHIPQVVLFDSLGSSEAVGLGASLSMAGTASKTAAFALGENVGVFAEDGTRVQPGSGDQGMVAVSGYIPLGYYKDEVKTAATFRTFEGRRWSVPGDWAEVNEDGTLKLLGRGSVCINTGGEKVFPEEVEEALKRHPGVRDAVCVGVPDERFGEAICAMVEPADPAAPPVLDDLAGEVRASLASYKAPRHLVVVDTIGRAPNGKVDYRGLKDKALRELGS